MSRRTSIIEDVAKLPWQVGIVLAVLCYPTALLVAGYFASNPILKGLADVAMQQQKSGHIWTPPLNQVLFRAFLVRMGFLRLSDSFLPLKAL